MAESLEKENCDYLQLRHVSVKQHPQESTAPRDEVPRKIYKSWKRRWVVLHSVLSPVFSFVGHCKTERDWLVNSQSIAKCFLGEFKLSRPQVKGYGNVLQLSFKLYAVQFAFDSMTKMDQWYNVLQKVSERYHVDLVRCPEHPEREGEFIMEVCTETFKVWNPQERLSSALSWEWQLKQIRRIHYHWNVGKLEVEVGRSAETGEGHFYFTGHYILNLFNAMKELMTSRARVADVHPRQHPRNDFYEPMSPHINGQHINGHLMMRTSSAASVSSAGSGLSFHRSDTPRSIDGYDTPRSMLSMGTDSDGEDTSSESACIATPTDWCPLQPSSAKTFPLPSHLPSIPMTASSSLSLPPPLPSREPKGHVLQASSASISSLPGNLPPPLPSSNGRYMHVTPATKEQDSEYVTIRRSPMYRVESPRQRMEGIFSARTHGQGDRAMDRHLVSQTVHTRTPPPIPEHSHRRNSNTFPKAT